MRPQPERDVHVVQMYHPSHHVLDLAEAEAWFARVFGRASTPISALFRGAPPRPGRSTDYSTFTPIQDVLFDCIDPRRYLHEGRQPYPDVTEPHLQGLGWYVADIDALYLALRHHGLTIVGQDGEPAVGEDPPRSGPMPLFFTLADETGLRFEFVPEMPFPLDPRLAAGWSLPPVSPADPLGIVRCSHHTVLTDRPERVIRLLVDLLGGRVVHLGRDEVVGGACTSVRLADAVLQVVVPDPGTAAHADWSTNAPRDTYHSLTFQVTDLPAAEHHLRAQGIGLRTCTDAAIVTEPSTSLGVPWGFVPHLTPGDDRAIGA